MHVQKCSRWAAAVFVLVSPSFAQRGYDALSGEPVPYTQPVFGGVVPYGGYGNAVHADVGPARVDAFPGGGQNFLQELAETSKILSAQDNDAINVLRSRLEDDIDENSKRAIMGALRSLESEASRIRSASLRMEKLIQDAARTTELQTPPQLKDFCKASALHSTKH